MKKDIIISKKLRRLSFEALFFVMAFSILAHAQSAEEAAIDWAKMPLGKMPPIASYDFTYYPKRDVNNQDASLAMSSHEIVGVLPLVSKNDEEFTVAGFGMAKHLSTGATLPKNNVRLPQNLYNIAGGPFYRKQLENGWTSGIGFLAGSASNELFQSGYEITVHADAYVKIPVKEKAAWFFYVDYNNNRDYLRNWPIPGAGYWCNLSENLDILIGLPAAYIDIKPTKNTDLSLLYIAITNIHAKASYDIVKSLELYAAFDWNNQIFARADREMHKDRLCYYEKALTAGLHWQFMKYAGVTVAGGYAFDRYFYEAKRYAARGDNRINFDDGPFIQAHVGIPF